VALSAETVRLQTELLQLHLLHRDAAAVDAQWRASARRKLGVRFAALARESRELHVAGAALAEQANARALWAWGRDGPLGLEAKIQMLDGVLAGVWGLGEPGGRYARVVRRFERWAGRAAELAEARRRREEAPASAVPPGEEEDADIVFVGELDAAWKEESAGLVRKLEEWRRQLRDLQVVPPAADAADGAADGTNGADGDEAGGQPPPASSLARIVGGCTSLVDDMLAGLAVMDEIEKEAIRQEDEWVRMMINRDEDGADDTPKAGAIWRVL
jgi:hypothetical protein